jgi:hypothetical protein
MFVWRAYQYVFYKLWRFQRAAWVGLNPVREFTAFMFFMVLQSLNLWALVDLLGWRLHRRVLPPLPNYQVLCASALFALPQYFLLVYRGRPRQIAKQFAHESMCQGIVGGIIVAAYAVGSFIAYFWSFELWRSVLAA